MKDSMSPFFEAKCEELDRLKDKILNIVTENQKTHFNFDNLIRRTLERNSSNIIAKKIEIGSPRFATSGNHIGVNDLTYSYSQTNTPDINHRVSALSSDQYDIKSFLPTFQFRPDNNPERQMSYIDFTLCINKSKV